MSIRRSLKVLRIFHLHPDRRLYGTEIARLAHLPGGSIYPELAFLEREGWIESDWQDDDTRPRRRVYWLKPLGQSVVPK